ncbi:sensor domain-containing diguanylate cyclase [Pararobbsia silviterrae]|uniref:diguanylate cyclase n=1 Tax=Pararobbsia silviterrae TaxID=1792498 RepID=A0A494XST0_9BURK|nr:GGDEF domain-containing protein [Pararobbsia silviterrae]RKP53702.1 GGDEF domain-containing protein [Pararobbsia silviterrae]
MHVDLLTLYFLAIGTLFASAGMTLWDYRTHPARSKELKILAAGYATLGVGCAAVIARNDFPGVWGAAASNLIIVSGYLLVLRGIAAVNGRRYTVFSIVLLVVLALTWVVVGTRWPDAMWDYVTAIFIALASAIASRELLVGDGVPRVPSRLVAFAVTAMHAAFYTFRALCLPWLVAAYGARVQAVASDITMYEGVLYSVILPMTLLRLFREESHGELLRAAHTDYLTRLGNRRWFFEAGARVQIDVLAGGAATLLAFDLDHFKAINDRYGHKTGDDVLKSFANIARGVLGAEAIFARIGGEEFAALLPGQDLAHARRLGEMVARHFAETVLLRIHGVEIQATVSVGLASFGNHDASLGDVLANADRALYRAKSLGGNRLEVAQTSARAAVVS